MDTQDFRFLTDTIESRLELISKMNNITAEQWDALYKTLVSYADIFYENYIDLKVSKC